MESFARIKGSEEVEIRFNVAPVIAGIESHSIDSMFHPPFVVSDPITHDPAAWSPLPNEKIKTIFLYGENIVLPPEPVITFNSILDKLCYHRPFLANTLGSLEI